MKHGVLLINKPAGLTSFDVVRRIKTLIKPLKVGHTGTLDPMAEGLLPLTIGEATKLTGYLQAGNKRYRTRVQLGQSTDTLDREGRVMARAPIPADLSAARVEEALACFRGEIQQVPPMYSALHHRGRRLHELARQGLEVPRKARTVQIHELSLLRLDADSLELDVSCSAGTYIRSLGADIAEALGSLGHLTALVRTESSGWKLEDAVELEGLNAERIFELMLELPRIMERYGPVLVPDETMLRLSQGQRLAAAELEQLGLAAEDDKIVCFAPSAGAPLVLARLSGPGQEPAMRILRVMLP